MPERSIGRGSCLAFLVNRLPPKSRPGRGDVPIVVGLFGSPMCPVSRLFHAVARHAPLFDTVSKILDLQLTTVHRAHSKAFWHSVTEAIVIINTRLYKGGRSRVRSPTRRGRKIRMRAGAGTFAIVTPGAQEDSEGLTVIPEPNKMAQGAPPLEPFASARGVIVGVSRDGARIFGAGVIVDNVPAPAHARIFLPAG